MRLQEQAARLGVRRDALQQRERVAHAVGGVRGQRGRGEQRVDRDDLLQQRGDRAERVPFVGFFWFCFWVCFFCWFFCVRGIRRQQETQRDTHTRTPTAQLA